MNFLQQFILQLQRQFKIKIFEKSALVIIFLAPLVLGAVTGIVFLGDDTPYKFPINGYYPSFLFMMIITSVFLGLLISIIEIMKERQVVDKEKLFGISVYSYYFAKLAILSIGGLIQILILYVTGAFILEVPYEIFTHNISILYVVIFNSISLGLLVSSLVKSFVLAYNMVSILVLPQILLGGGFIAYDKMSHIAVSKQESMQIPFIAKALPASWAYEDIIITNSQNLVGFTGSNRGIDNLEITQKDEYRSLTKTLSIFGILKYEMLTSLYNKLILLLEALLFVIVTLFALTRKGMKF